MSTLLQVRTEFVDFTGRNDLVVDTSAYADAGADVYINKAIRLLEQKVPSWLDRGHRIVALAIDDLYIEMESTVRQIEEIVLVIVSSGSRSALIEKPYDEIILGYSDLTVSGAPKYWCRSIARPAPEQASGFDPTTFDGTEGMHATEADFDNKVRLLLNVPVSVAYSAHVFGSFYSTALSADADTNSWTTLHPDMVVLAAQYWLEVAMHNDTGSREKMKELLRLIQLVEFDNIALEMDDDPISFGG